MKKFNCSSCKLDLLKVGIDNIQTGAIVNPANINTDLKQIEYKEIKDSEFNPDGIINEYNCGNCGEDIENILVKNNVFL